MKIMHIISSTGFFGAENVVFELSRALSRMGHDVSAGIITSSLDSVNEFVNKSRVSKIKTEIFSSKGLINFKTILSIRKYVIKNNIEVINSHNYKSNFYTLLACIGLRVRKVTTFHNWLGDSLKMKFYNGLDKLLLSRFDRIISVSHSAMEEKLKSNRLLKKTTVIQNGITLENFDRSVDPDNLRSRFGISGRSKIIGSIGRLDKEKGHIYLLEAVAKIFSTNHDIELLIVGDGSLRTYLKKAAVDLNIKEKVKFLGIRKDVPDLLKLMDIFVLPSLEEAMPVVLLEAMAAKIPIISTEVGEVIGIIKNHGCGILVKPGDAGGLADAILRLLKDENERKDLRENAFQVVRLFSAENMATNYEQVYKNTAGVKSQKC